MIFNDFNMNMVAFENRNGSLAPQILRLEYKQYYIYYIIEYRFDCCGCNYIGCDGAIQIGHKIKIRKKADKYENCAIIPTRDGKTHIQLPVERLSYSDIKMLNPEEVINIVITHWNIFKN